MDRRRTERRDKLMPLASQSRGREGGGARETKKERERGRERKKERER